MNESVPSTHPVSQQDAWAVLGLVIVVHGEMYAGQLDSAGWLGQSNAARRAAPRSRYLDCERARSDLAATLIAN